MSAQILVADDDFMISMLVSEYLKSQNHSVDVVSDGAACLEYLDKSTPNLLVLDFIMPKMTGLEVLKKIRSSPDKQNLKILLLSADEDVESICKKENVTADRYLLKPFDLDDLLNCVNECLITGL